MGRNVISAKLDVIFKTLFTQNQDLLYSFISSMLDIPLESISEITVTNPELTPETISGKFSRLDLSMKVDDRLVNVEIQVKSENDYCDRTLFYWAKLYTSELKSGDDYSELKKTITINIINFNMFDSCDYHTEIAAVIKGTDKIFSDKFGIHFFELKKVGKKPDPKNSRELWLQFIKADKEEDFEMINQTNVPVMQKAVKVIYDMSEDTRIRELARMREKALHDEATALKSARNEGIAEGIEKGKAEGRAEERARMIESMKIYGMSEEQIKNILHNMD
ncbi:MAG: Rpn family recombination-promoting nuclease/putative transposase [Oscillospiraceae bacterium]|nr:Rpn family recombination-promoting nuclease/putative transposase [Oscillospiraceae bacterium]